MPDDGALGGKLWAIVLAAGNGRRLEPFLRARGRRHPIKQYCPIVGRRSMLQHTWDRVERLVPRERVVTVVDATHRETFAEQLAGRAAGTVVSQPVDRDTAAGTLLPLLHVLSADPEAVVALFPSDHFVAEEDRFMAFVALGESLVRRDRCDAAILGVEPDRPDPDYGWIEVDADGRDPDDGCVLPVRRFWEKPEPAVASRLHEAGALWSTMVTVARGARLWALVRDTHPALCDAFGGIRRALGTTTEEAETLRAYRTMPSVSLSRGVFERVPSHLRAVGMQGVRWSDWGREERINETLRWLGRELAVA